jgi:hypothetical protein
LLASDPFPAPALGGIQPERVRQHVERIATWGAVDPALQRADRPRAETGSFGQFLLAPPGRAAGTTQQLSEVLLVLI